MRFILTYFPICDPFEKRVRMGVTFFKNRKVTILVCRDCSAIELLELIVEELSHGVLCLFLSIFYKECKSDRIAKIIDFPHKILYPIFYPKRKPKIKPKPKIVIFPSLNLNGSLKLYTKIMRKEKEHIRVQTM